MIVLCYFELHYIVQFFDSCDFVLYYTHTHTHTHTYIYIYIYIYIERERERERESFSNICIQPDDGQVKSSRNM